MIFDYYICSVYSSKNRTIVKPSLYSCCENYELINFKNWESDSNEYWHSSSKKGENGKVKVTGPWQFSVQVGKVLGKVVIISGRIWGNYIQLSFKYMH